ncbi:MAG: AAA family ATPase [Chlorobiaceae bacterium]|nr:AAA family ATPase [Chlorobiaceae bacterium]
MEIKLQRLSLQSFKGVQEFGFEPEGQNATIYGRNGAGKSTVADALSWVLFGKNQAGDSAFSVKTLDDAGQEIHNLEHEVEAVLRIEDLLDRTSGPEWNRTVTLRKVLLEKWTKKRGSQSPEFSGHETTYYIDSVPKPKKDFDAFVAGLVREDLFRMLTSITHFNAQKWQDRRRILLEVAGDVTDVSVIEAHGDKFAELPGIMENRTFEDTLKMLKSQRKAINDSLDVIPARIDEASKAKPGEAACMPPQGIGSYPDLTAKLRNLQNGRAAALAGDTSEVQQQIAAKKAEIEQVALDHRRAVMDADEKRRGHQREVNRIEGLISEVTRKANVLVSDCNHLSDENDRLRTDFKLASESLEPETTCSLCGQELPAETAASVLAKFRHNNAEKIKSIRKQGQDNNAMIERKREEITKLKAELDELHTSRNAADEAAALIKDPEGPNMSGLQAELAALTLKLTAATGTPDTAKVDAEIEQAQAQIKAHDDASANNKLAAQIDIRIAELKADQKRLGSEIDELDRKIMLCEDFTRAKVSLLEDGVAEKFAPLGFRLFSEQINGGLAECCETLVPSPEGAMVPWSDCSTGGKIRAGLKIIEVLGEHYGISAPCFLDNFESVTRRRGQVRDFDLGDLTFQTIKLVASDEHDGLTVEIEQTEEATA